MLPMGEYTLSVKPNLIRLESSDGILVEIDEPLTSESFNELIEEMRDEIENINDVFPWDIVNAIHLAYEDDPPFEVDCLLWLKELAFDIHTPDAIALTVEVKERLKDMGRCEECGRLLEKQVLRVPHTELDGNPYETITEWYCPNCDLGGYNEQ